MDDSLFDSEDDQQVPRVICNEKHVWYIYLHLPKKTTKHVGRYTIHGSYKFGYCFVSRIKFGCLAKVSAIAKQLAVSLKKNKA